MRIRRAYDCALQGFATVDNVIISVRATLVLALIRVIVQFGASVATRVVLGSIISYQNRINALHSYSRHDEYTQALYIYSDRRCKAKDMTDFIAIHDHTHGFIGVDIGGTSTRVGFFQTLDTPAFMLAARFPTQQNYERQIQNIITAVYSCGIQEIAGIGVSIGGRIAQDGRSVIIAPNIPEYIGKPFAQDLSTQFGCPVHLAHDAVCGLLGEKKFGGIRTVDRCAYLTVSTGTGAAFQLQKAGLALTASIEIGHQILDGNPLPCLCGQVGCLETFTGGRQLELRQGYSVAGMTDSAFWETFSAKLALGLINLVQLTRVEAVTVSGAIALNNVFLLPLLQEKINKTLVGTTLRLSLAVLGENAPIVGAALLLETPEGTILH